MLYQGLRALSFAALFLFVRQDRTGLEIYKVRGSTMGVLKRMLKMFRKLWHSGGPVSNGIDGHKWESKVEVFRNLSSGQH